MNQEITTVYSRSAIGILMVLAILCCSFVSTAQEVMVVERILTIDQDKPIFNIHVDEDNNKWIANATTVYYVQAKNIATPLAIRPSEQSLLQLPGGNFDLRWNKVEIKEILGVARVTTAAYDKKNKELWIGTDGYGLFKLSADDSGLRFLAQLHIDNSKLRSDFINSIYITPKGKIWVGTQDGAVLGEDGQWKVFQKFFNIQTISGNRSETWAIGDGLVWIIDRKDNWQPYEINRREIEGEMHDIAVDEGGKIWIASNIMTSYRIAFDRYEHFGPGQYFTSQFVNYVSVDHDGTIWVGTDDKGVYIIEKESTITVTTNIDNPISCDAVEYDAQVSIRAIGGTPPYTFVWSHDVTGDVARNLGPGGYTITVTDTEGTSKIASVEISDPNIVVTLTQEQSESDVDANDAIATMIVKGGAPGYRALWSYGSTEVRPTDLTKGVYSVTVTDQVGCTGTAEIEITREIRPLEVTLSQSDSIQCPGSSTGIINAIVSGGQRPYRFTWSDKNENSSDQLAELGAGTYQVQVTDQAGTTAAAGITIVEPEALVVDIRIDQPASTDASDGQATGHVTGGTPPYQYVWSNNERTATATQLEPRIHTLAVTDAHGCLATANVEIQENILPLSLEITITSQIICPGDATGALTAAVRGGKKPFTFQWSNAGDQESLSNLATGLYDLTVTDVTGATTTGSIEIEQPDELVASIVIDQPASTDNSDGKAHVDVDGGSGTYAYSWDNTETGATASNLSPGIRTVTITDGAGCTEVVQVTITENILPLTVSIGALESSIACAGQQTAAVTAKVNGGKGPFTYRWSSGATTPSAMNLGAGNINLTVTDVAGSEATAGFEITEPQPLSIELQVRAAAATDAADGKARARVSGGIGVYSYSWDNGETTVEAVQLPPGIREITVTDEAGCTAISSIEITEDIQPLSVTIDQTQTIACAGHSTATLSAKIAGGKAPFAYTWSSGASTAEAANLGVGDHGLTITDVVGNTVSKVMNVREPASITIEIQVRASANTNAEDGKARARVTGGTGHYSFVWDNGESTAEATKLAPGRRTITVTDEAGCTAVSHVEITEDILPLTINLEQTQEILCAGTATAALQVEIAGGKSPFVYAWSDGTSEETLATLRAGSYAVTVTDAAGNYVEKGVAISEPAALSASVQVFTAASTNGSDGKAEIKAGGGTGRYTFDWDNGETGTDATRLTSGDHIITVTDAAGCTAIATVSITENILPLKATISIQDKIKCAGGNSGSIAAEVTGGKGPFVYTWADDPGTTGMRSELLSGNYSLTVTDVVGNVTQAQIDVDEPEVLTLEVQVRSAASTGNSDGTALARAHGGVLPYVFNWENDETGREVTTLAPGIHMITVTDANGCTATEQIEISENVLPLSVSLEQRQDIQCAGRSAASIRTDVVGGKPPYRYRWSVPSADGAQAGDLGAGIYVVTVTDAIGQEATAQIVVSEPDRLTGSVENIRPAAAEHVPDGKASAAFSGGTPPYRISWDSDETGERASHLSIGTHTVQVQDAEGCTLSLEFEIIKRILPELTAETLKSGKAVRMEQLHFEADSTKINEVSKPTLNELYQFLYDNPTIVVEVGGHTNGLPEHEYCDRLSTARAKSVAQFIVQSGIDEKRVYYKGYGKRKPVATNRSPEGRRKNQRVEVRILKLAEDQ